MSVLCACLCLVLSRTFGIVLIAVLLTDISSRLTLRVCGHSLRVGSHIGNKTLNAAVLRAYVDTLVELLSDLHDLLRLESELSCRLLLHSRGREGGRGKLFLLGLLYRFYKEAAVSYRCKHAISVSLAGKLYSAVLVAVEAHGELLSVSRCEKGVYSPIFNGYEIAYLLFSLYDHSRSDRLNASCGKSAADVLPEERRDLVAYYSIENSSCLLSVDKIHIYLSGLFYRALYSRLCDLVEGNSESLLHGNSEGCREVPGDSLSLTVRVGREEYLVCRLGFLLDLLYKISLTPYVDVVCLKIILNVNAKAALGKIAHVSL